MRDNMQWLSGRRTLLRCLAVGSGIFAASGLARSAASAVDAPRHVPGYTGKDRLVATVLNVTDLERSLKFYLAGLGMREKRRQQVGATTECMVGYSEDNAVPELMLAMNATSTAVISGEPRFGRVILEIPQLDALCARIPSAGGKIVKQHGAPGDPVRTATIHDPDGHEFECVEFQ